MSIKRATALVERVHGQAGDAAHTEAIKRDHFTHAIADPLYRRLTVLFGDRLVCTRPHRTLYAQLTRVGQLSLVRPQGISERIKTNKEYCFETLVLRVGTGVFADDIAVGDRVVVSQFAGSIWYDIERGRESELWMFASGDVLMKLLPTKRERTPLDDVIDRYAREVERLAL